MAAVYAARDLRYDRDVAVKVLETGTGSGIASERFLREIAVVAKLTHPHIVPLLDSGETNGRLWFVMPVLEGDQLRARLDREGQLPVGDAVRICHEVAMALAYAHERGVIHRDIKPENVLISGGSAAVSDFGLVKLVAEVAGSDSLTHTGIAVGTTHYMSPEQATGDPIDARSDIYSLGCMLYEMLTGEPPYSGRSGQAVMAKHLTDPVPRAKRLRDAISPALDEAIATAMAKQPVDRFPTAMAMAEALQRAVSGDSHASVQAATLPPSAAPSPAPSRTTSAGRFRMAAFATGMVAVAAALWLAVAKLRGGGASSALRSIAVLPFSDLSAAKNEEFFSAGMTDELIGLLTGIDGLRVAPRASSYAFRDQAADLAGIGAKLNVDAVLEGSVRRDGDHVRVLAELVSVSDRSTLWRQNFDRTMPDVFALQEEIARAIVSALRLTLAPLRSPTQRPTDDVEAYQLYLRGRYAWNQRTPASLRQADVWFRQAVDRDPGYARAWAGIADVHIVQALNFFEPPGPNFELGKAAALKAIALDSTLAEAHASLATVSFLYDRDWSTADAEYRKALSLDPNYSSGHYFYTLFLSGRRRPEALAEAKRAMQLDPFAPPIAQTSGIVLLQDARYAEAIPPLRAAIALQPQYYFPHAWLAIALAKTGAREEAMVEIRRAAALAPESTLIKAIVAFVQALTGDRAGALGTIAQLDSIGKTRPIPFHYIGRTLDVLGDGPRALAYFRRAVAAREGQLSQLGVEPRVRTLANDPEYLAMLKQLNLR